MTQIWTAQGGQLVRLGYNEAWVPGVIRPDQPGMAGVPDDVTLTSVTGDINITDSGPDNGPFTGSGTQQDPFTLYRLDVAGSIIVKTAKFVHIYQCDVHSNYAPGTAQGKGIINCYSNAIPDASDQVTIKQCNVHNDQCCWALTGIFGHSFTSKRNHITYVEDGIGSIAYNDTGHTAAYVTSMGDWIEKLIYFEGIDEDGPNSNPGGVSSPSSHRVNGTHTDCWHLHGGSHHIAIGSYFHNLIDTEVVDGVTPWIRKTSLDTTATGNGHNYYGSLYGGAAVQFAQNEPSAPINDVTIKNCWLDGGFYATMNYGGENYPDNGSYDNHIIQDNIFYKDTGWTEGYWTDGDQPKSDSPGYAICIPAPEVYTHVTFEGNLYFDGSQVGVQYGSTLEGYA